MSEYTKKDLESESDVVKEDQDLPESKTKLKDLAIVFTKLGAIAFG